MNREKKKKEKRIWYTNKSTVIVFIVLRVLIVLTAVLSFLHRDYECCIHFRVLPVHRQGAK